AEDGIRYWSVTGVQTCALPIWRRSRSRHSTTGQTLYGPTSTNAIFAGFGGVCASRPNGDAVVRYDQLADRWLIVMPIFRRTVFDPDRSAPGQPARPGEPARPGAAAPPPPPPPLPPAPPP